MRKRGRRHGGVSHDPEEPEEGLGFGGEVEQQRIPRWKPFRRRKGKETERQRRDHPSTKLEPKWTWTWTWSWNDEEGRWKRCGWTHGTRGCVGRDTCESHEKDPCRREARRRRSKTVREPRREVRTAQRSARRSIGRRALGCRKVLGTRSESRQEEMDAQDERKGCLSTREDGHVHAQKERRIDRWNQETQRCTSVVWRRQR